jgi:hypothetical protein
LTPKDNPPVNILLGDTARQILQGDRKVHMLYRDKLAEKLGVAPKERLTMTVVQNEQQLLVSVLLDGGDLTPAQEEVFREFLEESGVLNVISSFPEKPVTS